MFHAVSTGDVDLARMLWEKGASLENIWGLATVFHYAAPSMAMMDFILDAGYIPAPSDYTTLLRLGLDDHNMRRIAQKMRDNQTELLAFRF